MSSSCLWLNLFIGSVSRFSPQPLLKFKLPLHGILYSTWLFNKLNRESSCSNFYFDAFRVKLLWEWIVDLLPNPLDKSFLWDSVKFCKSYLICEFLDDCISTDVLIGFKPKDPRGKPVSLLMNREDWVNNFIWAINLITSRILIIEFTI